jgi:hypothetical protein
MKTVASLVEGHIQGSIFADRHIIVQVAYEYMTRRASDCILHPYRIFSKQHSRCVEFC